MTLTMHNPVRLGDAPASGSGGGVYRFAWSSDQDEPTFWVYRAGKLIQKSKATSIELTLKAGESAVLFVSEGEPAQLPTQWPGVASLHWDAASGTDYYLVEEYVSSSWVERARVRDRSVLNGGSERNRFSWTSRTLEDVTSHQFRVTAVGTNGNSSTATSLTVLMVRKPDVPDVTFSYSNDTDKVTISAA